MDASRWTLFRLVRILTGQTGYLNRHAASICYTRYTLGLVVIEMQRHEFIGLLGGDAASPFALAAPKDAVGEEPCARSVLFFSVSQ